MTESRSYVGAAYVDLDGTLLGKGGSLLYDLQGRFTDDGVQALRTLAERRWELVLVSGRRRYQLAGDARLLRAGAYVAELGAMFVDTESDHCLYTLPECAPYQGRTAWGAARPVVDRLIAQFPGKLESHTPWNGPEREVTQLLRGDVDLAVANQLLREEGDPYVLVENGRTEARMEHVADPMAYHLCPVGVGKMAGVHAHREHRGYPQSRTIAIGDSLQDLAMAEAVGRCYVTANGVTNGLADAAANFPNVVLLDSEAQRGVRQAVELERPVVSDPGVGAGRCE